ncbi:histone PARylation factor 1 [Belonocnema kinseyi]|uniref:histone PARylation factor 1 n=1 Tax=Belonocnema kinseyi TaxID=2817044 RepID=UPI00143DCF15|nr:histone PARylation factor 1 [Belonocnema kinseyi]
MYKNPKDMNEDEIKQYKDDPRYSCQFGVKCYQKNPVHHKKYKHPPKSEQQKKKEEDATKLEMGEKRKAEDDPDSPTKTPPGSPQAKHLDKKQNNSADAIPECSSSPEKKSEEIDQSKTNDVAASERGSEEQKKRELSPSPEKETEKSDSKIVEKDGKIDENSSSEDHQQEISKLFLTEMPQDFYQFYDFCKENSKENPALALKIVDLKLVGPFDLLLGGKFSQIEDKGTILTHWRYFYDPPEFQTILKGNDKDGLHFGYWRDDPTKMPVFIARNDANVSCKIVPVAENLFGTVDAYLEERIKLANPFEKATIARLQQKVKAFAKEKNISLEKHTPGMKERERKVVARTLHGAGIVAPYDRKTQVGYRKLATSEADLQKMLKKIKEAETDEERKSAMSDLQEVIRWATIAADECDFGTCLELGHDLFSSGVSQVQDMALQMLSIAYGQIDRPAFLKIAEAHFKDRKTGSTSLSIL